MSHESIPVNPERTSAEIAESLSTAVRSMYELTASTDFENACTDAGVNPYDDFGTAAYLQVMANVGDQKAAEEGDMLQSQALRLITATPMIVRNQVERDSRLASGQSDTGMAIARQATDYNEQLREFSTAFPSIKAADLEKALLDATNMVVESQRVIARAPDTIRGKLRGIQHEIAVGKIIELTGRQVTPGSSDEDLSGDDWIVTEVDGTTLYIDAKASLREIDPSGKAERPYAVKLNGAIALYSMCRDTDFRGMMVLPDAVAAAKAPAFDTILDAAQRDFHFRAHPRNMRA